MHATLYFYGVSSNNPRPAAATAVLTLSNGYGYTVAELFNQLNKNEAAFNSLILGLEKALELGCKTIEIYGDSHLVIKAVTRYYEVGEPSLLSYLDRVNHLLDHFEEEPEFRWIPCQENGENSIANTMMNECIKLSKTPVSSSRQAVVNSQYPLSA
jgi:ribonuclease HI